MKRCRFPGRLTVVVASLCIWATSCAHRPVNVPLNGNGGDARAGYYFRNEPQPNNADDTLFILAFSGGGTRAAAFAAGVLEELRDTVIERDGRRRRMLDEVDAITAVSGGSVAAAAYGLHGDNFFQTFDRAFLKRNVQRELLWRLLNPLRWPRIWSPHYGRSEMAAEFYDKVLYHDATFADLQRPGGPFIIINATDISSGARFEFTQHYFDLLCSDVRPFPVSRAVAASSAVPGLLTPITLNNYAGDCGYERPAWLNGGATNLPGRLQLRAGELATYFDRTNRPYIHLVDGGVSDNLGLRSLLDGMYVIRAQPSLERLQQLQKVKRLVLISANAYSSPEKDWDRSPAAPGSLVVAATAASHTLDRFSFETVELLKDVFEQLRQTAGASNGLKLYPVLLNFTKFSDPKQSRFFLNLPTSFVLPGTHVDQLRGAGRELLRDSPEFKAFLRDFSSAP